MMYDATDCDVPLARYVMVESESGSLAGLTCRIDAVYGASQNFDYRPLGTGYALFRNGTPCS